MDPDFMWLIQRAFDITPYWQALDSGKERIYNAQEL